MRTLFAVGQNELAEEHERLVRDLEVKLRRFREYGGDGYQVEFWEALAALERFEGKER